ncbi:hypothetical protein K435DRAFT_689248 [Dendrothele bispora CBS 962.96]|uniref:Uncharacterized protein n=1 Tax=Dendrothele bispora (strain CBS 962.96) TaxID=1314807 RepID=A0A4S8L4V4_DENBC|nr:hypothetical protein K435DRAFT_689248 [Dendrothele bispora CBS 962.96]
MSSEIDEALAPFLKPSNAVTRPISTTAVTIFDIELIGVYTILFGKCIHLLCWRYNQNNRNLYLVWTTALFVLITAEVIFGQVGLTRQASLEFSAAKAGDYGELLHYLQGDHSKTVQQ